MLGTVIRLFNAHFPLLLCWLNFDFIWGVTESAYKLASASSLKAHSVCVANDTHAGRSWERLCFLGGMEWMYLTKSFPLSHAFLLECGRDVWIPRSHLLTMRWQTWSKGQEIHRDVDLMPPSSWTTLSCVYFQFSMTLPHVFLRESNMFMKSK